nr:Chain A, Bidentatide [Achyranthes bidentata]8HJD_A Chain A, Gly-bidentatide [Achyranthes bidentata]
CLESGTSCIPGAQHNCCSGVCVPIVTIFYGVCY